MRVNSAYKNFFNNRLTVSSGIIIVVIGIFFIASSFTGEPGRNMRAKEINLMIRQMGHRLLLQAGDSTSRVLPVTEISDGTFQLVFESEFSFNHDSLTALSQDLLPKTQFSSGYTITVHDCINAGIVYGFKVNASSPNQVACLGRRQPAGCYRIEIAFPELYKNVEQKKSDIKLVFSSILVVLGVTLLFGRFGKILKPVTAKQNHSILKEPSPGSFALGKLSFDVKGQRLLFSGEVIPLTEKECKVLELLNKNFGELIPRETLMQKVWINEGVITGRSLDMFVSKLRKKLSRDPELRITNIHGKGYKLEIPPTPTSNS